MAMEPRWRVAAGLALAVATITFAAISARRSLRGPARPFAQRPAGEEVRAAIDAATRELLALQGEERAARLRQMASPDATAEGLDALATLLETMSRSDRCELAHADAYGPRLIKAIYNVRGRDGRTKQTAIVLERRDGGAAFLAVSR